VIPDAPDESRREEIRLLVEEALKDERRRRCLSQLKDLINSYADEAEKMLEEFRNRDEGGR